MKREFTRGVAWIALAGWVEQIAAVGIFLVISRLIGPAALGIAAMAFAFLLIGELLLRDTLTEAIVERHELEDGRLEATFVCLLGLGLAIAAILLAGAYPLAAAYGDPLVAPLLVVSSPTVLFVALAGVPAALLRRQLQFRRLALPLIIGVCAGGVVGIGLAVAGFGPWSLIGQRLATVGVHSLSVILAAGWRPRRLPRRDEFGMVRGLGPQVVLLRGLSLIVVQTPTVALGLFSTPDAVGRYFFAARLVEIVQTVIVVPIRSVAQSSIAEGRRRRDDTAEQYLSLTEFAVQLSFPTCAGLALVAVPTVALLMGPGWGGAGAVIPFLAMASAVGAVTSLQESYLLAFDRLNRFVRATALEAGLGLVLCAVAAGVGAPAVAVAVLMRSLLALPFRTHATLAPESIALRRLGAALIGPAVAAGAMAVAVAGWMSVTDTLLSGWTYLLSAIAAGVIAYSVIIFAVMPASGRRLLSFLRS